MRRFSCGCVVVDLSASGTVLLYEMCSGALVQSSLFHPDNLDSLLDILMVIKNLRKLAELGGVSVVTL